MARESGPRTGPLPRPAGCRDRLGTGSGDAETAWGLATLGVTIALAGHIRIIRPIGRLVALFGGLQRTGPPGVGSEESEPRCTGKRHASARAPYLQGPPACSARWPQARSNGRAPARRMHERRRARAGLTRFAGPRTERRLGFARLQVAQQEWGALTRLVSASLDLLVHHLMVNLVP